MTADTWYSRRPWEQSPVQVNQAIGPDPTNQERIVSDRLAQFLAPPPPPPQRVLFPPRFGYTLAEPGITDIINVAEEWPKPVDTYSRDTYGEYSGTSRPSFSNDLGKP